MATEKQIGYALALLADRGFSAKWMDRTFARLGAKMRQRSGTVRAWLSGMETAELSALIDTLKAMPGLGKVK